MKKRQEKLRLEISAKQDPGLKLRVIDDEAKLVVSNISGMKFVPSFGLVFLFLVALAVANAFLANVYFLVAKPYFYGVDVKPAWTFDHVAMEVALEAQPHGSLNWHNEDMWMTFNLPLQPVSTLKKLGMVLSVEATPENMERKLKDFATLGRDNEEIFSNLFPEAVIVLEE